MGWGDAMAVNDQRIERRICCSTIFYLFLLSPFYNETYAIQMVRSPCYPCLEHCSRPRTRPFEFQSLLHTSYLLPVLITVFFVKYAIGDWYVGYRWSRMDVVYWIVLIVVAFGGVWIGRALTTCTVLQLRGAS